MDTNWCADSLAWRKGVSGKTAQGEEQGQRRHPGSGPGPERWVQGCQGQGAGAGPGPGSGPGAAYLEGKPAWRPARSFVWGSLAGSH